MASRNDVYSRSGECGEHARTGLGLRFPECKLSQLSNPPVASQAINSHDPRAPSARVSLQSSLSTHGHRRYHAAGELIATQVILHRKLQNLTRKNLDARLAKLFADCTGLRFHVSWSPPPPLAWDGVLPAGCAACLKRLGSTPNAKAECRNCEAEHVALTLQSGTGEHTFTCPLGTANFWVPITVQTFCLGIVGFQAMQNGENIQRGASSVKSASGRGSLRVASAIQSPVSSIQYESELPVRRNAQFDRAARLLRLIIHDVVETVLADLQQDELQQARRALSARDKSEARLRQELHQMLPVFREAVATPAIETRAQQVVRRLLNHIDRNYGQPVQLKECAEKIGMNPACLSGLFSQTVGLPFKKYLTKLRLEKAQELLSDPRQTIAEVAYAVGYTDPNRFRLAFKDWAGLPPSAWRGSKHAKTAGHSSHEEARIRTWPSRSRSSDKLSTENINFRRLPKLPAPL
jgi:AraC-like DNA-binding protein